MSPYTYTLQAFTYTVLRSGWSEVAFRPRVRWQRGPRYEVSSQSDVLGELVAAVIALLQGAERRECVWHSDFARDTVRLDRERAKLRIEINSWFPPRRRKTTEDLDREPWRFTVSLLYFAKQLRHQLTVLLNRWGLDGYQTMWPFPFPLDAYRTLGQLIDERTEPSTP